jgi:hypothetical protein
MGQGDDLQSDPGQGRMATWVRDQPGQRGMGMGQVWVRYWQLSEFFRYFQEMGYLGRESHFGQNLSHHCMDQRARWTGFQMIEIFGINFWIVIFLRSEDASFP